MRPSNRPRSEREVVDDDDPPLIDVEPRDGVLEFAVLEPKTNRRRSTCFVQLTNRTVGYVAFKFKASNIRNYAVCPNMGLLRPFAKRSVKLTRIMPRVDEPLVQHPDIFLLQTAFPDLEEVKYEEEVVARNLFRRLGEEYTHQFKMRVMRVVTSDDHVLPQPVVENQPELKKSDDEYVHQYEMRVVTNDDHIFQQATVLGNQPEQKISDYDGAIKPWEEEKLLEELLVTSVESDDTANFCTEKEEENVKIKSISKELAVTAATRDQQSNKPCLLLLRRSMRVRSREQFTGIFDVAVMLECAVVVGLLGFLIEQVLTL